MVDGGIGPTCTVCGRVAAADEPVATTWMSELDPRRGEVRVCPQCVRGHVRAIEARLDRDWW